MKKNDIVIGIVGSTGAVGIELINNLHSRYNSIQYNKLILFSRSNKSIKTHFGVIQTQPFNLEKAKECSIIFLAVNSKFSREYAKKLIGHSIVIDNSSAFRYDFEVPLIIPEINGYLIKYNRLISNPNCTTAIALMVLFPIYVNYGIKKIIISTYQAASGAGKDGVNELINSFETNTDYNNVFTKPLRYNVIPHIDEFMENGYTKEEMKVVWETKKILNDDKINISCTCVRVPVIRCHSESITIETEKDVNIDEIKNLLRHSIGVKLLDDAKNNVYPTPLEFTHKNDVGVGRIRQNLIYGKKGIDLFVCGDQLLRGAAYNAVLIAEYVLHNNYSV